MKVVRSLLTVDGQDSVKDRLTALNPIVHLQLFGYQLFKERIQAQDLKIYIIGRIHRPSLDPELKMKMRTRR